MIPTRLISSVQSRFEVSLTLSALLTLSVVYILQISAFHYLLQVYGNNSIHFA